MKKKFVAVTLILALALPLAGCAGMKTVAQAPCPYMAQAKVYKDKIKASLVSAQAGYDMVVGMAKIADKLPTGSLILAQVKLIDAALDLIGTLYYDNVCPTPEQVEKAAVAAAEAEQAQEALGITE